MPYLDLGECDLDRCLLLLLYLRLCDLIDHLFLGGDQDLDFDLLLLELWEWNLLLEVGDLKWDLRRGLPEWDWLLYENIEGECKNTDSEHSSVHVVILKYLQIPSIWQVVNFHWQDGCQKLLSTTPMCTIHVKIKTEWKMHTVPASPVWLGRLWPGSTSATTAVSSTVRAQPFPGRRLRPWSSPGRMWFYSLLVRRQRSGLWPPSLGAEGVKCASWGRGSRMGSSARAPGMRLPSACIDSEHNVPKMLTHHLNL